MGISVAIRSRGYLPHWEKEGGIYFVTFRLGDSLPRKLIEEIRRERKRIEESWRGGGATVSADRIRCSKLNALLKQAENWLDRGLGQCYMRNPVIARRVAEAIEFFGEERYRLLAWCVMPNHVHILFSLLAGHNLASVVHSWKSYSAHQANAALGRCGAFWQREYFDHLVRSETYLQKFAKYIEENPKRAGLGDWPWVRSAV